MEVKKGQYRHFKGGLYEVIGVATDSESQAEFIVYQALYGEKKIWIRPISMFFEEIEREGKQIQRFEFIE